MQILKNNIRVQIERAALMLFAAHGFDCTTMAEIAAVAGISTGNLYRYHSNKEELLYALIPESFVENCLQMLRQKIDLAMGMNAKQIAVSQKFRKSNVALLKFILDNRQKLLILLRGCSGTRWQDFRTVAQQTIIEKAGDYFAGIKVRSDARPDPVLLTGIYENLMNVTITILGSESSRKACRLSLIRLMKYHQSGLAALC